jgi:hypothetical protein
MRVYGLLTSVVKNQPVQLRDNKSLSTTPPRFRGRDGQRLAAKA